jgi:RNA polymerase sigma-70 factor (ECF subfamily)
LALLSDEGDRQLFEQIYMRYRKQMFVVARSYLQNDADAEDAVHDVFVRIASACWDTVRKITDETDLRNYLLKAAKNRALNILDRSERKALPLQDAVDGQTIPEPTEDDTFAAVCARTEETRLLQAIRMLPERYCDALYYRFVLQLSVPETARALEQSVAATKKQIQRGKKKLLEILGEEYVKSTEQNSDTGGNNK